MQGHRNGVDHGIRVQCWKPVNPEAPVHMARRTGLRSGARRPGQERKRLLSGARLLDQGRKRLQSGARLPDQGRKSFQNSLLRRTRFHKRYWDTCWASLAGGGAWMAYYSGDARSWSAGGEERRKVVGRALSHLQGWQTACEHRRDSIFLRQMPHLGDRDISSGVMI